MKKKILPIIITMCFSVVNTAQGETMFDKIFQQPIKEQFAKIDVNPIINEYFCIGMSKHDVLDKLKDMQNIPQQDNINTKQNLEIEQQDNKIYIYNTLGMAMFTPKSKRVSIIMHFESDKLSKIESFYSYNQ